MNISSVKISVKALIVAMLATMSACKSDFNEELGSGTEVYQQYEIFVTDDAAPAAFANLRNGNSWGDRLEVSDGKMICNAMNMYYTPSESNSYPEYNYAVELGRSHQYAEFKFKRSSKKTLKNLIYFNDVPALELPRLHRVENGTEYTADMSGISGDYIISITLSPSQTMLDNQPIPAMVDRTAGKFRFVGVPAGTYVLRSDVIKSAPTVENDGNAGGNMRVVRRKTYTDVSVPVEVLDPGLL